MLNLRDVDLHDLLLNDNLGLPYNFSLVDRLRDVDVLLKDLNLWDRDDVLDMLILRNVNFMDLFVSNHFRGMPDLSPNLDWPWDMDR